MRVGLVWLAPNRLTEISVRYERYVRGFRELGHEPITVCLPGAAVGYGEPVECAPRASAFHDPEFYRGLRADAFVIITWLGMSGAVAAAKAGGGWVASIADSDGKVGVRVHPRCTLARMMAQQPRWPSKIRAIKHWMALYAWGPLEQDQPVLDSSESADRIAVCSPAAAVHLRRFFAAYGRANSASKVVSIPYPIDECYLRGAVVPRRENRVVAIGRWDDPQKDAELLCRTADRFYSSGGRTELHLFGQNGDRLFLPLARKWPKVFYHGSQPPAVLAECLGSSRALFLPSRWESGPIVMNEALASGCTVVATDAIPAAVSACSEGGFGTVSVGRSSTRLSASLQQEMTAWDRGERNPATIATYWRPRFEPSNVCASLLPAGKPSTKE